MALSYKHQDFINEYFLRKMNGTDAYQAVYPKASYDAARANAAKLLANTNISAEIDRRLREKQLSADEVLARLGDMARADIADFAEVRKITDLQNEQYRGKTHVIKKFKRKITRDALNREREEIEIELYGADVALVNVGRHHKLFNDSVKVDDWRTELIELFKQGKITKEDLLNEFADTPDIAKELFESIGLRAIESRETQVQSAEIE